MRERIRDKGRLEDIRHYSEIAESIVKGMSYDDFMDDVKSYYAVMKTVEIVGEAAYMLTKEFKRNPFRNALGNHSRNETHSCSWLCQCKCFDFV